MEYIFSGKYGVGVLVLIFGVMMIIAEFNLLEAWVKLYVNSVLVFIGVMATIYSIHLALNAPIDLFLNGQDTLSFPLMNFSILALNVFLFFTSFSKEELRRADYNLVDMGFA